MSEKCCSGYPNCFHEVGSEHLSREARGHEISHDIADQQISALRRQLSEAKEALKIVDEWGRKNAETGEEMAMVVRCRKALSSPAESREEGEKPKIDLDAPPGTQQGELGSVPL